MSNNVFANGNAISCKAGDGKVIAAMPDVCLSPPSPPAGPVPIPYPNTSFSKDMKEGSKTVQINDQEVMLKDQSYFKTSPLGDEAATNSFGGSVITHVITGKTYFNAWSMDVQFEGANVDRHLDLTTSNHASYPGSTGPMSEMEKLAVSRIEEGKCPCCGKKGHYAGGVAMNMDEWYANNNAGDPAKVAGAAALLAKCTPKGRLMNGCSCSKKKPPTKMTPEAPCNVFFHFPNPDDYKAGRAKVDEQFGNYVSTFRDKMGVTKRLDLAAKGKKLSPTQKARHDKLQQVNHLTPRSAGGCPDNDGNLEAYERLCDKCQGLDDQFSNFQ